MKSILGLDVGSHSVKATEFHQALRGLEASQMRLESRTDAGSDLPEFLNRFVKKHHLGIEHFATAVPGDQLSTRKLEFPFRDRKKLAAAIPFELEGLIPFELENVVVDWCITSDSSRVTKVLATVARRDAVSALLSGYAEAGLEPRVLEAEGLVLGNLTAVFDLPGNRLILDLGHRKTAMCLLIDGRAVNARSISVGGLSLTRAIAEARGCGLEEAEQIKYSEGIAGPGGTPLPEAAAALGRIVREIVRFLESNQEYIVPSDDYSGIDEITIVGGTSKLIGIREFLEQQLKVEVCPLEPPTDTEKAELIVGGDPVLFANAIALAVRATSLATTQMNFRQDEFAFRMDLLQVFARDLRPTAILAASAIMLGLTSFVTSIALDSSRASALERKAVLLYSEAIPGVSAPQNPVTALSQELRNAKDRADFLGIYGTNLSAIDLLAELSQEIPEDLNVKFEEISINRRIVKIKVLGETYEAADRLKSILDQSASFSNAVVDKVKTTRQGKGKRFNLTLNLDNEKQTS